MNHSTTVQRFLHILFITAMLFVTVSRPYVVYSQDELVKGASTQEVNADVGDFRPSYGKVSTYVDVDGNRVVRQEMVWKADRISAIQNAKGSIISDAVTYEHGFNLNDIKGGALEDGVWTGRERIAGMPVPRWANSNLPEWYIDTSLSSQAEGEVEVTIGTANAKKLEANVTYFSEIALAPGDASIDNAKITGDLGYHFAPCLGDHLPPFCIDDRHHWTVVPAWNIPVPSTYSWSTEGLGSIQGRVFDKCEPVNSAHVLIKMGDDVLQTVYTDENGYYVAHAVPAALRVTLDAYHYTNGPTRSSSYYDPSKDGLTRKSIDVKAGQTDTANIYIEDLDCQHEPGTNPDPITNPGGPTSDTTPPTASSFDVSVQGGSAQLTVSGVSDSQSGIKEVRYSAKWNGSWHSIGNSSTAPYSLSWNMCNDGVPNGTVEFGMEVWDNSNNKYVWSNHYANPVRNKSFDCNPSNPGGGSSGSVKLYSEPNYGGTILWSGDVTFSNEPNREGYSLSMPDGWSVRLWRDDNRQGEMRCFSKSQHNLQDHGWQLAIQSLEVFNTNLCGDANTGVITACSETQCWDITPGYIHFPDWGMNDQIIKIIGVPSNMSIMLFRETGLRGTVECYNSPRDPLPNGGTYDLYKQATDAIIFTAKKCPTNQSNAVIFHSGHNYEGYHWSAGVGPGSVNMRQLGMDEFNDEAESVEISTNRSIIGYEHDDKQGIHTACLTGSISDLGEFKNMLSSVEVFENTECRPDPPSRFRVIPTTAENDLWLNWSHRDQANHSYKIYKWDGSDFKFLVAPVKGESNYVDSGLECGSTHFYKISALNDENESYQVGWIQGTTAQCSAPAVPQRIDDRFMYAQEYEPIVFTWYAAENALEYKVDVQAGEQHYTSDWQAGTTWVLNSLPPGQYVYEISARNNAKTVTGSSSFLFVGLADPVLTNVSSPTCSSMKIEWDDYGRYESRFLIVRDNEVIAVVPTGSGQVRFSYTDEGLEEGSLHSYKVVAPFYGDNNLLPFENGNSAILTGRVKADCIVAPTAPTLNSPANNAQFELGEEVIFTWTDTSERYIWHLEKGGVEVQQLELTENVWLNNTLAAGTYQWYVIAYNGKLSAKSQERQFVIREDIVVPQQSLLYLPLIARYSTGSTGTPTPTPTPQLPNLAQNESFESGSGDQPESWSTEVSSGSAQLIWDRSQAHSGSSSLRIGNFVVAECTSNTNEEVCASVNWLSATQIAIDRAHTYRISAWYKNETSITSVAVLAQFYDSSGRALGSTGIWGLSNAPDWTARQATISSETIQGTFPNAAYVRLSFGASTLENVSGSIWIDDIRFEDLGPATTQ